ncbi:MAG: SPOR domain-containing protein, partial [Bacteroidales bacterium]|nr:SPOR domain-containing protein [Bacteroidales bacterium]
AFSKSPDAEMLSVFAKVAADKVHVKFPHEGLQIYRIGVFSSYDDAQNTLKEAKSLGIADAFIVAFNGDEQISSSEALRLQNTVQQLEQDSEAVKTQTKTSIQDNTSNEIISQNATQKPEYYVQLGAFVYAPDQNTMTVFRNLAVEASSSMTVVRNGRFNNYRIGGFSKLSEAKKVVELVHNQGIKDAFVIAVLNGERISVSAAKELE